ncbi:DUF1178 family protein [Pigmentiphaga litoralis]|uniref:DUF1178 family protein n=1 Tax=Pigmentiphaga litoralis TaxID=516702 RepID=A0A7Y9IWN9_9BURK|nr:DUF1178 family protein [Pigmentiphaga litoralis]NYE21944.1 hypothetical protein [Pigmentiphaga litoralis]NYE84441.1 hypothetical protein [Pigmentiphaga litoralis]
MSLKVFDLQCAQGHVFEGWFGSHADYDAQHSRGLITCPLCGNGVIEKKLSAPRLNVSGLREGKPPMPSPSQAHPEATSSAPAAGAAPSAAVQAQMLQHLRQVIRNTENVGTQFADEARRIHHGDAPERPIRGVATADERQSLTDEGIAVAPIPAMFDDDRLQ